MDAKRGDIGSTMAAYADAYLRQGLAALLGRADRLARTSASARCARRWTRRGRRGAGRLRARADLQPGGRRGAARDRARDGRDRRRDRCSTHLAAENAGERRRSARSARSSAPRSGDAGGVRPRRSTGRCSPPASAPRARPPRIFRGSSAPAVGNVVPSVSRGVLRHGPDVVALREAADRFADEVRAAVAGDGRLTRSDVAASGRAAPDAR